MFHSFQRWLELYKYNILFTQSLFDKHLDSFLVSVMNNAIINTHVPALMWSYFLYLLVEFLGSLWDELFRIIFCPKIWQIFLTSFFYCKAMAEILLMVNNLGSTNDTYKKISRPCVPFSPSFMTGLQTSLWEITYYEEAWTK